MKKQILYSAIIGLLLVSVSVNGKVAHFQAIAIDGRTLDEFDIESPVR